MSERGRKVRGMSDWMLKLILMNPLMRSWHPAVRREQWLREIEDVLLETVDEESGPWPVSRIGGLH